MDIAINYIDMGIIAICMISAALAMLRGLVHEILAIISWVISIWAMFYFFPMLRPYADTITSSAIINDIGTYLVIFIIILTITILMTRMIGDQIQKSALGVVDRTGGIIFGTIRGWIIICIIYILILWVLTVERRPEAFDQSAFLPYIRQTIIIILNALPQSISQTMIEIIDYIKDIMLQMQQLEKNQDALKKLEDNIGRFLGNN